MKELAIVGGGIGGLTLAICLQEAGYHCHIYEKKPQFGEVGAAISVFPNALKVYQKIGLLEAILPLSGIVKDVFLKTQTGRILSKTKLAYELPTVCMHRRDLHALLLKRVEAALYTNHELHTFSTLANGRVELGFTNGTHKTVDALIGADGIHSRVRQQIINDGSPIFRGYNIWRGICQLDIDAGYGSESYGVGKRVGIVPIEDGQFGWWATRNEAFMEPDEPAGSRQKLLSLFGHWHAPIPELIQNTEHIIKNSLSDRVPVKGWSQGSVVLLGDAAHPTTPNLGQGACMAIEGAYILAKCIETYGLGSKAFTRYEALHFCRAKDVVETSLQIGKLGQIENRAGVLVRNLLLALTPSKLTLNLIGKYLAYDVTRLRI